MEIDWELVPRNVRHRIPQPLWVAVESGCWEWQGERNAQGYGLCNPEFFGVPEAGYRKRNARVKRGYVVRGFAHRTSYAQNIGPIPDGLVVRHGCDNPPCVNPDHLELGSRADNQRDMAVRGRGRGTADTCKRGHDLTVDENVRWSRSASAKGGKRRRCLLCEIERGERKTLRRLK